ncbi:hypothetical protein CAQU_05855 [Corynebacterium aquilae DSM 44791]|uniref:TM2 domain-containing protein n=2 Tax=Corynebacterium aquilae TaxID=203263 RepID=A0A1L7CFN1_9CORY|nr:hypothetical protein CAQU_05855 [Corynebacterium aquilae DSM 44791]
MPQERKSKLIAVLLAFFLGSFGVHDFYAGYTMRGLIKLGLTTLSILTFGVLGILFGPVLTVWIIVDIIMILIGGGWYSTDSKGNPFQ